MGNQVPVILWGTDRIVKFPPPHYGVVVDYSQKKDVESVLDESGVGNYSWKPYRDRRETLVDGYRSTMRTEFICDNPSDAVMIRLIFT